MLQATVNLLGLKARDKVTGFEGVISSVCFDLYGCVQVIIVPPAEKGECKSGSWFDVNRLEVLGEDRAMPVPTFDAYSDDPLTYAKGASDKPLPGSY